jgi:hypothetical protein
MGGLRSPDIPAYWSYLIVLLVGMAVARSRVNSAFDRYDDRWAFAGTWSVFLAYTIVPVILLYFLDFTSVINDTSLFAALVIAFGYRQIFVGGIQGIAYRDRVPGFGLHLRRGSIESNNGSGFSTVATNIVLAKRFVQRLRPHRN